MPIGINKVSRNSQVGNTVLDSELSQTQRLAHFDAEYSFSSSDDGTTISKWPDGMENYDVTGGNPTVRSSGINSNLSVEFDGANDNLDSGTFSSPKSQPQTIFIVAEILTIDGFQDIFSGVGQRYEIGYRQDHSSWFSFMGSTVGGVGGNENNSNPVVLTVVADGVNSLIRANGIEFSTGDNGGNALDGLALGYRADTTERYVDGYIGEVVVADERISSTTISNEESRLANKWGITI